MNPTGQITRAGSFEVHGETVTGFLVTTTREAIEALSRIPMYKPVVIVESENAITLPLDELTALVRLAQEQTRYIEEMDRSLTGSIYGIEYADKTIAKVAVRLP